MRIPRIILSVISCQMAFVCSITRTDAMNFANKENALIAGNGIFQLVKLHVKGVQ